jgi:small subunit ribosomal protein S18
VPPSSRKDRGRTKTSDPKGRVRRGRPKVCVFCTEHIPWVDYKDMNLLRRFMSDRGKIKSRANTGTCRQHQSDVALAIKNARELALLPYAVRTLAGDKSAGRRGRGGPGGRPDRPTVPTVPPHRARHRRLRATRWPPVTGRRRPTCRRPPHPSRPRVRPGPVRSKRAPSTPLTPCRRKCRAERVGLRRLRRHRTAPVSTSERIAAPPAVGRLMSESAPGADRENHGDTTNEFQQAATGPGQAGEGRGQA